jgi:type II secretion system (T2SS) protein E
LPILARILRDRGVVTERQLQEAIQHQVLYGGRLGTNLYELGFVTEERLQEALARAHGVPALAVDLRTVQPEVVALVPKPLAVKHKVFPYRLQGRTLTLLMLDPGDHVAVARIGYSQGYIVKTAVVSEFRMVQLLRDYYGVDEKWRFTDTHRPPALPATRPRDARAAEELLDEAQTRDEVVEAALGLCLRFFRRVVFFIVREPWCMGWHGAGEGMDRALAASLKIPLDQPSVFQAVARNRTVFIGRLAAGEENQRFLRTLAKRSGTNAALLPIAVRSRVVNLIYGDNGTAGNLKGSLGELLVLLQRVPKAYLRIIRRRIALSRADSDQENENKEKT